MYNPKFENPNEIECARCGERIYIELSRCPNCGASLYPEDENEAYWQAGDNGWRAPSAPMRVLEEIARALGWLAAGWLAAGMLSFLLYIPLRSLVFRQPGPLALQGLIFACAALGAAGGGFLIGRFAGLQADLLGPLAGALTLPIPLILNAHEFGGPLHQPLGVLFGVALVILAALGATRLGRHLARQALLADLFTPAERAKDPYQELLEKVRFENAAAERLIDYERQRNPNASRDELIRAAIRRWERDNR